MPSSSFPQPGNGSTGSVNDPWVMYDHKKVKGGDELGRVRLADYSNVGQIRNEVLDNGGNVFTMVGGKAYFYDKKYGVTL